MEHGIILIAIIGLALYFLAGAHRHARAIIAVKNYQDTFEALCDDDTVNLELLENMQKVFTISCHWCGALRIAQVLTMYEFSEKYRRAVELRSLVSTKRLRPETARMIVKAYESEFLFASYSLPFAGWVIRKLIRKEGRRAYKTMKPAIFLNAGEQLLLKAA